MHRLCIETVHAIQLGSSAVHNLCQAAKTRDILKQNMASAPFFHHELHVACIITCMEGTHRCF